MNRTTALLAQWVGRLTVVVALVQLIWTWADLAGSNNNQFGNFPGAPNGYLLALSSAASLSVLGMLAIGLGMMLERVSHEQ